MRREGAGIFPARNEDSGASGELSVAVVPERNPQTGGHRRKGAQHPEYGEGAHRQSFGKPGLAAARELYEGGLLPHRSSRTIAREGTRLRASFIHVLFVTAGDRPAASV